MLINWANYKLDSVTSLTRLQTQSVTLEQNHETVVPIFILFKSGNEQKMTTGCKIYSQLLYYYISFAAPRIKTMVKSKPSLGWKLWNKCWRFDPILRASTTPSLHVTSPRYGRKDLIVDGWGEATGITDPGGCPGFPTVTWCTQSFS